MVHSSPLKRSALGSISSILNTTPKTPAKQGRVGKSATPRSNGIRQKIAHIFSSNKENSSRKRDLENWTEIENIEVHQKGRTVFHLANTSEQSTLSENVFGIQESRVASVGDVFHSSKSTSQQTSQPSTKVSPEVRQIATLLSERLRLAAYKVSTQQIHIPLSELAILPTECPDQSVSNAVQRFRESKRLQDQADYFRKRRLSTICRRESRRSRRAKSTNTKTSPPVIPTTQPPKLTRQPSMIIEVPSDQEEQGLPSPPDSQITKTPLDEIPSTPAPKPKTRRIKRTKTYDEYNGYLGLSSPPQQAYDPKEDDGSWFMEDVEVGDVPSSVLRGVEGLWALGC